MQSLHDITSARHLANVAKAGVWGKIPSAAQEFPTTGRLPGVFTQQEAASRRPRLTGISAKLKICQRKINELQAGKTL